MSSGGPLNLGSFEDLDRVTLAQLDDRHRGHLDPEELLDGLTDLRLVRVLVHAERVLAVLDQAVALLRDHGREQDFVRMQAHLALAFALPWTASSAASLTSSACAQTIAPTSTSDGWTTTTRSRLRNDFTSPASSSFATSSTGRSWPQESRNAAAALVEGSSKAEPSTTPSVPSAACALSTPRRAER